MPSSKHPLRPGGVYVIAEAGVNHNGDVALARSLIDAAVKAGADAVKFQLFSADELASVDAPLAAYQERSGEESQHAMLTRLSLPLDDYRALKSYADAKKIDFITTPFDVASAKFLASLGVAIMKIPSGELTNIPFLTEVAQLGIFTIISTGMATMDEVRDAVAPFLKTKTPFALLHCVSAYPAPIDQINLKAMETLRNEWHVPVGYSDHTEGIDASVAAAALGAEIIEKHFTIDRSMDGPDHAASLEPAELTTMVDRIRDTVSLKSTIIPPAIVGDGVKRCQPCEENTRDVARRSAVVLQDIPAGTVLTTAMIGIKRPGTGIAPKDASGLAGKKVRTALRAGTVLTSDMIQ